MDCADSERGVAFPALARPEPGDGPAVRDSDIHAGRTGCQLVCGGGMSAGTTAASPPSRCPPGLDLFLPSRDATLGEGAPESPRMVGSWSIRGYCASTHQSGRVAIPGLDDGADGTTTKRRAVAAPRVLRAGTPTVRAPEDQQHTAVAAPPSFIAIGSARTRCHSSRASCPGSTAGEGPRKPDSGVRPTSRDPPLPRTAQLAVRLLADGTGHGLRDAWCLPRRSRCTPGLRKRESGRSSLRPTGSWLMCPIGAGSVPGPHRLTPWCTKAVRSGLCP
ncbi:hypothetical protein BX265_0190 [Streptomyces sp. TLI_235]|nr:hypothetical protein BX265_0190 [Streptomyces sp. TLI_235]